MHLTEEQLKKYTCKLEKKFFDDFLTEYQNQWYHMFSIEKTYDSNDMLEFLYTYPEINDRSKEYFYFLCEKTFADVPAPLAKKYKIKFALVNCGKEIYNSYTCAHSNLLIDCLGVKQSFGCLNCKFSNHLLYCTDLRHKSYVAFNIPLSKSRFNEIIKLSPEELKNIPEFNQEIFDKINWRIEWLYRLKEDGK